MCHEVKLDTGVVVSQLRHVLVEEEPSVTHHEVI